MSELKDVFCIFCMFCIFVAIISSSYSYAEKFAVILGSGHYELGSIDERHWNNCSSVYRTLKEFYGYTDENIFVAFADGTNDCPYMILIEGGQGQYSLDFDSDGTDDIEYSADDIEILLDDLNEEIDPNDSVFIYTTGHGHSEGGTDVFISLWLDTITDDEFADEINELDSNNIIIVMQNCYSGGFVDDLAAPGRVVITSVDYDEMAKGRGYAPHEYSEFTYHVVSALRCQTLGDDPAQSGNNMQVGGVPVYSDVNEDNIVSMEEVYEYICRNDEYYLNSTYTPQYYSNPSGLGDEWALGATPDPVPMPVQEELMNQLTDRRFIILGSEGNDGLTLEVEYGALLKVNGVLEMKNKYLLTSFDDVEVYLFDGDDTSDLSSSLLATNVAMVDLGDGDDSLSNSSTVENVLFQDGNDYLLSMGDIDYVDMGDGNNSLMNYLGWIGTVVSGNGTDIIQAMMGDIDDLSTGAGDDDIALLSGCSFTYIDAGPDDDYLSNSSSVGTVYLGDGSDDVDNWAGGYISLLYGGSGNDIVDIIAGSAGSVVTGNGNDAITAIGDIDYVDMGDGADNLIVYSSSEIYEALMMGDADYTLNNGYITTLNMGSGSDIYEGTGTVDTFIDPD